MRNLTEKLFVAPMDFFENEIYEDAPYVNYENAESDDY